MAAALDVLSQISTDSDPAARPRIASLLERTGGLLEGHFALQRGRHTTHALRFRAIAREREALKEVSDACLALATWSWKDVVVLSPESAGFFLGDAIAHGKSCAHAVVQTDLRRRPIQRLTAGEVPRGASVVIVNDVSSTGESLQPLVELVRSREGTIAGVLLFAVVGVEDFVAFRKREKLQVEWLVTAKWKPTPAGPSCPGCAAKEPLIPIAEFS